MKFATILREAGYSVDEFKKCAEIEISLVDEKNRIESNEDVHYAEKLFAKNFDSYAKFRSFLINLEENPADHLTILITEHYVVVTQKLHGSQFFPRKIPLGPLDYMD